MDVSNFLTDFNQPQTKRSTQRTHKWTEADADAWRQSEPGNITLPTCLITPEHALTAIKKRVKLRQSNRRRQFADRQPKVEGWWLKAKGCWACRMWLGIWSTCATLLPRHIDVLPVQKVNWLHSAWGNETPKKKRINCSRSQTDFYL